MGDHGDRLEDAKARGANILGEVVGYAVNSDASDFVLPDAEGQKACMRQALERAGLAPEDIDIVNTHSTATPSGDIQEAIAVRGVFEGVKTNVNNTKSYIGHTMGAAGALELAGNLPSFDDKKVHPTINVDNLDPNCKVEGLVVNQAKDVPSINTILNNSFGMLGINSTVIVKRYTAE